MGTSSWNTVLQGIYYFPSATVQFVFDGFVDYSVLVAKDISFLLLTVAGNTIQSGANNNNDFSSLSNGSPVSYTHLDVYKRQPVSARQNLCRSSIVRHKRQERTEHPRRGGGLR